MDFYKSRTKELSPFKASILLTIWLLIVPLASATERIPPKTDLVPNSELIPKEAPYCERLILRERAFVNKTLPGKEETLVYLNYLLGVRFYVNSNRLTVETGTVRKLLYKKFGQQIDGHLLYRALRKHFESVQQATLLTEEGQKLNDQRDDANYKTWDVRIIIRLAKQLEKMGLPFERDFLLSQSSLIGMKLAETYGYPVRGEQIVYRTEKLNLSIEDIRRLAKLPKESPHLQRIEELRPTELSQKQLLDIFKFLQSKGFELLMSEFKERSEELTDLIYDEFEILVTPKMIHSQVLKRFGGFPKIKQRLGITYEGRKSHYRGRPDWSDEFFKKVLKIIEDHGFELSNTLLLDKELFAPVAEVLFRETNYHLTGKQILEKGRDKYGSMEKAAQLANVRWANRNLQGLGTKFETWEPEANESQLNPILLVDILTFIDSLGYQPNKAFLESEEAFARAKEPIEEEFELELKGEDILKASIRFFASQNLALDAAGLSQLGVLTGNTEISDASPKKTLKPSEIVLPESLERALTVVLTKYPDVTSHQMRTSLSVEIGDLLLESEGQHISGAELYRETRTVPGGFKKIMASVRHKIQQNNRVVQYGDLLDKELFLEVIQLIQDAGIYPSQFDQPEKVGRINDITTKKYGHAISVRSIELSAEKHFGSLAGYRKSVGLPYREPDIQSDDAILDALKIIVEYFPTINTNEMNTGKSSRTVGALLKRECGLDMAGNTFTKEITKRFGGFSEAFAKINYTPPWSKAYQPSRKLLLEVIALLLSKGHQVELRYLKNPEIFEPMSQDLEEHFGYKIAGVSIYNNAKKHFGNKGGLEAAVIEAKKLLDPTEN